MMKQILLFITMLMVYFTGNAQDRYRVNGKIEGVSDGILLLLTNEKGTIDTLQSTRVMDGAFEFAGEIKGAMAVYITTPDQSIVIPLILENTNFTINAGKAGLTTTGGFQQTIYDQFSQLNSFVIQQQKEIEQKIQVAYQGGDNAKIQELADQFNKILAEAQLKEKELLEKFSNTYAAAYVVASGMYQLEPEILKTRYNLLGENAKTTVPGKAIATFLEAQEKLSVGNIAPDFTIDNSEGGTISLGEIKGSLKLIDFWASWCAPCREENVNLLKLYQQYRMKGLEIVSISLDTDKQAWLRAIGEDGLLWHQGIDVQGLQAARPYFVRSIPYSLLLDQENRIVAKNLRGYELQKKIETLLKGK